MTEVRFASSDTVVGPRLGLHPSEEGNRASAWSPMTGVWSAVEVAPRERIEEIQRWRLRNLLSVAAKHSPFYAERWRAEGIDLAGVGQVPDLTSLPIVTKEDFDADQRSSPLYGTSPTVPVEQMVKHWQTSGTSGAPRLWAETREDWDNGIFLYTRSLYAHGVRPGWKAFFAFSYPPAIAFWLAHYAAEQMGCQVVPKGPLPTHVWLRLVERLATDGSVMCATPTFAQRQLEVAADHHIDLPSVGLDVLSLAGEPGGCIPATKARLEHGWGTSVHDILGSTETSGPITFTCEYQARQREPSAHVNSDYFIVEVVDPQTLRVVPDGEIGVMCVTALMRFGMPAVRFLLNDLVQLTWGTCPCGRTLPLVTGGVRARSDDVVVVNGVNVYPSMVEDLLGQMDGLTAEYLLDRGGHRLSVTVEARAEVPIDRWRLVAEELQGRLRQVTLSTVDVVVVAEGTLPRAETKSRRSVGSGVSA